MTHDQFITKCRKRGYGTTQMISDWMFQNPKPRYSEEDADRCAEYCSRVEWHTRKRRLQPNNMEEVEEIEL